MHGGKRSPQSETTVPPPPPPHSPFSPDGKISRGQRLKYQIFFDIQDHFMEVSQTKSTFRLAFKIAFRVLPQFASERQFASSLTKLGKDLSSNIFNATALRYIPLR